MLGQAVEREGKAGVKRFGITLLSTLLIAGFAISFGCLMLYMSSGEEHYLYRPLFGCGPVVATAAIAAHQILGDAPIFPAHAPWLSFSQIPLVWLAVTAISQYAVRASRDVIATLIATIVSWVILRFVYTYPNGAVGDTRDEFEFLSLLPAAVRYV